MLSRKRTLPQGLAIASQSAEFWRRLAPELTISDAQPSGGPPHEPKDHEAARMRLVNDGFLHISQPAPNSDFEKIAAAMNRIVSAGLPAAFIGVYDEVWAAIASLDGLLDGVFDNKVAMVPNFWAGHSVCSTGIGAGRSRGGNGVFTDGTPKNVTVWMPVTNATPDNGCVYAVPAGQDKNYGKPEQERADASLPGIRCLPARAGDALIMTGELYHWQARPDRHNTDGPLLNLTWEFQSLDAEPLERLRIESFPYVPFETRLGLLASQMPKHRSEFSASPVWRAVQQTLSNRFPMPVT